MKKYLAIILGIMMIATAFCACGSDDKEASEKKSDSSTVQQEEKSEKVTEEATKNPENKDEEKVDEKASNEASAKEDKKDLGAIAKGSDNKSSEDAPLAMPAATAGVEGQGETKYGEDDVYTNANGVPAAKTESGTEVELTGETLQELMNEYGKVTGTGTQEEKELLEKIQVLLETMPYAQSAK